MPLIHKSEQTTLGNVFNLKDLDRKIYDDEEIKYFRNCWLKGINFKEVYKEYSEICSKEYFYQVYYE